MTIAGTNVTATKFTVDLTGLTSEGTGSGQRDNQVQGRILNTSQFPDATFTLTKPIALGKEPADGVEITTTATGNLTLHGATKSVTITDMKARRDGNEIQVSGSVPITFSDYGINNPSGGPAQVGNNGTMEFLVSTAPRVVKRLNGAVDDRTVEAAALADAAPATRRSRTPRRLSAGGRHASGACSAIPAAASCSSP